MIAPTRRPGPMPFTVLMDQAMREARRHWRSILPSVALPVAVLSSMVPVLQARLESLDGGASGNLSQTLVPGCSILLALLGLLALMGLAYTSMQVGTMDAVTGREVDMKRSWRFTLGPRVIGTLLLAGLAILGVFIAGLIPVAVVAGVGSLLTPVLAILVGFAGGVLLVLLMFFVAAFLTFVSPVMAEEGRFGASALRRSMALVLYSPRGQLFSVRPMWKVLGFLVVGLVISSLVGMLVSLPFSVPVWIDLFRKTAAGQEPDVSAFLWLQVLGQFVGALASSAVHLYVSFGIALLFFDSRGRKEGTDLTDAIDAMSVPPVPPSPEVPA